MKFNPVTFALSLLLPVAALAQIPVSGEAAELELGRQIYEQGMLPSGELKGERLGRDPVSGAKAACVHCHRRSGMGQVEGDIAVQPITGNFLFAKPGDRRLATMDPRVSKSFNQVHAPYTDASLAAAINEGVSIRGRAMNAVMPRYDLNKVQLKALTAYLRQLSAQWSPGVSATNIRFATVITPDVDPVQRKLMIDMLRTIFRQKNSSTVTPTQGRTRHHMVTAAEMILGTERTWSLDLWELQGAPETWSEQLAERYRSQPVFALLSGASNSTWQPVHDFCDRERVPCWFPSVDAPTTHHSPYVFYFSGGVALESAALAQHLLGQKELPKRVVQIYRDGELGRTAAQALTQALAGSGVALADQVLRSDLAAIDSLRLALDSTHPEDVLMFWLRPDDVQALGSIAPVATKSYFSGLLAKGERAPLAANWRAQSSLVYPYELPENRAKNLDYFHVWLNTGKLDLIDEAMQSEIFFALNFMTDTLAEMLDNVYRDYLVERAETMLSIREGIKSEQETRDRVALGRAGDLLKKYGASTMAESARIQINGHHGTSGMSHGTTLYPHLSLAPDQRFASKGAYIVRFANESGNQLLAESTWIIP